MKASYSMSEAIGTIGEQEDQIESLQAEVERLKAYADNQIDLRNDTINELRVEVEQLRKAQGEPFVCPSCSHIQDSGYFRCDNCTHEYVVYTHPAPEEVEALRKDAERYRWHVKLFSECNGVPEGDVIEELDAAIDAAMEKK